MVLAASVALSGCVSGSLASSTGSHPGPTGWSVAPRQQVHVGETVRFDFVLTQPGSGRMIDPIGLVDYCVVAIGSDRIHVDADALGHFLFAYTFSDFRPGEETVVEARAYRIRGYRDHMNIAGEWVRSQSPSDLPDRIVIADSIRMTVYALTFELQVLSPESPLEGESGVLRIQRRDGSETLRYIDRPHRPGFTVEGPDARGTYVIRYAVQGDELNSTGKTPVEFVIHDRTGKRIAEARVLDTP